MEDDRSEPEAPATDAPSSEPRWALIEIFGHRRHWGRVSEKDLAGARMLRVDVPVDGDPAKGWTTHLYGAAAIFSLSFVDEATVLENNRPWQPFVLMVPDRSDLGDQEEV